MVVSASYALYDTDLWSLLVGGKSIWTLREIPRTDLWTWRHHGEPQVLSAWLFRAMIWPVWSLGGVVALYLWRWASIVATFALLWASARAMGARGLLALVIMAWCALIYRLRTDIRPETLAALLFALQLWLLETRRQQGPGIAPGRDRAWWIVPIAWIWANAHISYYLGFLLLAIYLADAHVTRRRPRRARPGAAPPAPHILWGVALAAAAVSFLNPFAWRPLWQPFEFLLFWRNDPMFRAIGELHPPVWSANLRNGLPLLMLGWPALLAWRARQRGLDTAETLACALFSAMALGSQRFIGTYALIAAPFVARDMHELAARSGRPAVLAGAWPRAALAIVACVAISIPDWLRSELPLGVGIVPTSVPERACDFMATRGIRGRGYNEFHFGGYLAYRFWPDRERLPFMDTQPEHATPEDRRLAIASFDDPAAWQELDRRYRFDYLLLAREQQSGSQLLDLLDRESTWTMVFTDDVAELFVRRDGPLRGVAETFGYRVLPFGRAMRERLVDRAAVDSGLRARAIAEVERAVASSPWNGSAHHLFGIFALMEGRTGDARRHLEAALALKPWLPRVHELLGRAALAEHRPRDAIRELSRERRLHAPPRGLDFQFGCAYQQLGQFDRSRDAYRRELTRDPGNAEARDSLTAVMARIGR
jgi:tetratricopeptide (TPR) repeat protein